MRGDEMIGIVIVTHGDLGKEFIAAAEHVVGKQAQLVNIGLFPEDNMDYKREDIKSAVEQMDSGKGVILLTDLFGGTPSNLAISVMKQGKVEVIAGLNLPMLIKLLGIRQTVELKGAAEQAQAAGRKYINVASALLE